MPFIMSPPINPVIQKQVYKQYKKMNERIEKGSKETGENYVRCHRCKEKFDKETMIRRYYSGGKIHVNICKECNKIMKPVKARK